MISTIKGKIIFFITLVMVACTVVNIYFTNRDVGNAMLAAQEKSALNILHSLELIIEGDYSTLLSDKMEITLTSRNQLKNMARMIESVFMEYSDSVKDGLPQAQAVNHSLDWVTSAPFQGISYHIIDRNSRVLVSSNENLTNEAYENLKDIKKLATDLNIRIESSIGFPQWIVDDDEIIEATGAKPIDKGFVIRRKLKPQALFDLFPGFEGTSLLWI